MLPCIGRYHLKLSTNRVDSPYLSPPKGGDIRPVGIDLVVRGTKCEGDVQSRIFALSVVGAWMQMLAKM